MISQREMQQRAEAIRHECIGMMPDMERKLRMMQFLFSSRMLQSAGKAECISGRITLSVAYFADPENFSKHFRETVTHEIAHVLSPPVFVSGRRRSHGAAWKAMHRRLGGKGERCHTMTLAVAYQTARKPRVEMSCPACGRGMKLGPTQYKRNVARIQAGLSGYRHSKCFS